MKLPFAIAILSGALCVSAYAEDKSSLTKKGAKLLTGPEKAALYPGKTMRGTTYDKNGKKVATWTLVYAKDGKKTVKVRSKTIERKWWVNGNKFCETGARDGKTTCSGNVYKLSNQCYAFHSNGAVNFKMNC